MSLQQNGLAGEGGREEGMQGREEEREEVRREVRTWDPILTEHP